MIAKTAGRVTSCMYIDLCHCWYGGYFTVIYNNEKCLPSERPSEKAIF